MSKEIQIGDGVFPKVGLWKNELTKVIKVEGDWITVETKKGEHVIHRTTEVETIDEIKDQPIE